MASEETSSKYKWDGEWIESVIQEMLQMRYQTLQTKCVDKVDVFEYLKGKQRTTFKGREAYLYGKVGEYNVFISVPVSGLCSNPDRAVFTFDFVPKENGEGLSSSAVVEKSNPKFFGLFWLAIIGVIGLVLVGLRFAVRRSVKIPHASESKDEKEDRSYHPRKSRRRRDD